MNGTENKIRICALTTIARTMDWFVVDSMRNLSHNSYEVTLVCNMDEDFITRNRDYARCISLPMSRGVNPLDMLRSIIALTKLFRQEKFDIVYYTSPNASMYAAVAGRLTGIKKRVYSQCGLRYVSLSGAKRALFKCIEKFTCRLSTDVRSASPMNCRLAVDEGLCPAGKISVVGIGGTTGVFLAACDAFDHDAARQELRAAFGVPQDAFVYGYVGRINSDKGINELIEAFESIQSPRGNRYLILIGMLDAANPVREDVLHRAQDNEHIVFTGNVPKDEVYRHMAMFDVLTHPTYREGFGKVLQEAMGMRLPIITTNVPGPCEVVEDGISGILVTVKDTAALASAMTRVYEDGALRASLSAAGRARAETYFDRPIMLNNSLLDMNKIMGVSNEKGKEGNRA